MHSRFAMSRLCLLAALAAFVAVSVPAGRAFAHPLGNFTVSHYSALDVTPGRVRLDYGLDFAEIPTFQAMEQLDSDHDGAVTGGEKRAWLDVSLRDWLENLSLRIDGRNVPFRVARSGLEVLPGAGGLSTMKVWLALDAPLPRDGARHSIRYEDDNYPARPGWREIIAHARGTALPKSSVPATDRSARLTDYPSASLDGTPQVTVAELEFVATASAAKAPAPRVAAPAPRAAIPAIPAPVARPAAVREDAFTRLIHAETLTPGFMGFALLIAFGLGALHALSPGHGKTLVGAYLVGSRGTPWQAVFLGLVVTAAHTFGVFALGFITLWASNHILPERVFPWLGFASGMLVAVIGAALFHDRVELFLGRTAEHRHLFWKHRAGSDPDEGHLPTDRQGRVTPRSLLALGISGGIVPCPSALVVMLASIALHRVQLGLLLIIGFSLGLAASLTGIGLLFVYAGQWLLKFRSGSVWFRLLPVGSAAIVTVIGMTIAIQSLTSAGLLHLRPWETLR